MAKTQRNKLIGKSKHFWHNMNRISKLKKKKNNKHSFYAKCYVAIASNPDLQGKIVKEKKSQLSKPVMILSHPNQSNLLNQAPIPQENQGLERKF